MRLQPPGGIPASNRETTMTKRIVLLTLVLALPAFAGGKEQNMLIQLQTQVQGLQDRMDNMQRSFDERMGVMRNLVEQTTDNINKMNSSLDTLNRNLQQQNSDGGAQLEDVSAQVQALHDSLDELKARLAKVSKQLDDMNASRENLQMPPAGMGQAPPADALYNNALRDYNAGKLQLARQEFNDYLKFYGNTELAGNAQYYLADIEYRQGNFQQAVAEYDKVLEQYAGSNKSAAAQLKKGYALLELGQRDAGTRELNSLIARYPRSTEAAQARDRLKQLGASRARPSPKRTTPK